MQNYMLKYPEMEIITILLFKESCRFSELNIHNISSDQFTYYIHKLVEGKLIVKQADGAYALTHEGKNFAGQIDGFTRSILPQSKTVVALLCHREEKGRHEFLIQKRLKHPAYGYFGLPGGKVNEGELLEEAGIRELDEETGLSGTLRLVEIRHTIKAFESTHKIFSDDIVYCYRVDDLQGDMKNTPEGEHFWMNIEEIQKQDKVLQNTINSILSLENTTVPFIEEKHEYSE